MKTPIASLLVGGAAVMIFAGNAFADDSTVKSDHPVNDFFITAKVKAELAKDKGTQARHIHVDTKDGVVMLSGMVGSTAEKELAEKDAKKIKGVVDVSNDLTVRP